MEPTQLLLHPLLYHIGRCARNEQDVSLLGWDRTRALGSVTSNATYLATGLPCERQMTHDIG